LLKWNLPFIKGLWIFGRWKMRRFIITCTHFS